MHIRNRDFSVWTAINDLKQQYTDMNNIQEEIRVDLNSLKETNRIDIANMQQQMEESRLPL